MASDLTIGLATVDEVWNARHLYKENWEELASDKQVLVLKPDKQIYEALVDLDKLIVLGAYENSTLVGYSLTFLFNHPHYSDTMLARNDVLFLTKRLRRSRLGLDLIRKTEQLARERGAKMMLWSAKPHTALEQLMPRLGYSAQETIFTKVL